MALTAMRPATDTTIASSQGSPTHNRPVYQVPMPNGISASAGSSRQ